MVSTSGVCTHCGHEQMILLPVEPLFNREEVCALVPVKLSTLQKLVYLHKARLSPPKYLGPKRKGKRVYTADDVRTLRAIRVRSVQ